MPNQGQAPWSQFAEWNALVAGAVMWCGLPDPNIVRKELRESSDIETAHAKQMLELIERMVKAPTGASTREIIEAVRSQRADDELTLLLEVAPSRFHDQADPVALGRYLGRIRDRPFDGRKLVKTSNTHGKARWVVRLLKGDGE